MTDTRARLAQSQAAIARGELANARGMLSKLLAEPLVCSDAMHALAVVERRLRNLPESLRLFSLLIEAHPGDPVLRNNYANALRDDARYAEAAAQYRRAVDLKPDYADALVNLGLALRSMGEIGEALEALRLAVKIAPLSARAWHVLALAHRDNDDLDAAAAALDQSLELVPRNAAAMQVRARIEADRGRPALGHYLRAARQAPRDVDIAIGLAVSRFEEGDAAGALQDLERFVEMHPQAQKVHVALARLRWQMGDREDFARSFDVALERVPDPGELQVAHFGTLMRAGRYAAVLERLPAARARVDAPELFDRYEAVCASECAETERAERAFQRLRAWDDHGVQTAWIRHLLRTGHPAEAARFGEAQVASGEALHIWPYLHTCWRMVDDVRWKWLEQAADCVAVLDYPQFAAELQALARALRSLHSDRTHPFDQSLRHGTQSDGNLFTRNHPALVELRVRIEQGLRQFIDRLPPQDASHPFLRLRRENFRFLGAYSVLLRANGFHINHMHPDAWISCCFYVETPDCIGAERDHPAGWLMIGQPPHELGLSLPATSMIRPAPGRLALFPSFLWHGSAPFAAGERLTVVSDVVNAS